MFFVLVDCLSEKSCGFFHRSATATAVLVTKQKMLEIASHKLFMDVTTRWNSSMDMLNRYLKQQAAITATLSTELRKNAHQLDSTKEIVNLIRALKKMEEMKRWPPSHSSCP